MTQPAPFNPLVSIVIPVYNGSNYLSEAIDSALKQTYAHIEVLVVNDGSDDNGSTRAIALAYGNRIRYFEKENGGVATALNLGIREMRGEYFSWLSHDDLYHKNKIESQIAFLGRHSGRQKIVYSDCEIFTEDRGKQERIFAGGLNEYSMRYHLTIKSTLHGCSLLIPRVAFFDVGLFDEKLRLTQDYEMWFRLAGNYEFIYLSESLVASRHHALQDSAKFSNKMQEACDGLRSAFIPSLSTSDVKSIRKNDRGGGYLRIYEYMTGSGYHSSAKLALEQAVKSGELDGFMRKTVGLARIFLAKYRVTHRLSGFLSRVKRVVVYG